jgi:hypothetical protein
MMSQNPIFAVTAGVVVDEPIEVHVSAGIWPVGPLCPTQHTTSGL